MLSKWGFCWMTARCVNLLLSKFQTGYAGLQFSKLADSLSSANLSRGVGQSRVGCVRVRSEPVCVQCCTPFASECRALCLYPSPLHFHLQFSGAQHALLCPSPPSTPSLSSPSPLLPCVQGPVPSMQCFVPGAGRLHWWSGRKGVPAGSGWQRSVLFISPQP